MSAGSWIPAIESEKREHYLAIDSLQSYGLLGQARPAACVFHRQEDGELTQVFYEDAGSTIPLPRINAALSLEDIYAAT